MINQKEYKKLRAQGYRAITAKRICSDKREPLHNLSCLPGGQLVVVRSGFRFIVEMKEDMAPFLLEDLGTFTDEKGAQAIQHEPGNDRTFKWFVPANIGTVKELVDSGMDSQSAYLEIQKYGRQNYKRACSYGDDWAYYDLHVMVYMDQPEMLDHCLDDNWTGGIDCEYGKPLENWVSDTIEEQIHDLLPEAFKKIAEINKMFSDLTIGLVYKPRIAVLADELSHYGATFLTVCAEPTVDVIEMWAERTLSYREVEFDDLLPEGKKPVDWLNEVYEKASELAKYYKENK